MLGTRLRWQAPPALGLAYGNWLEPTALLSVGQERSRFGGSGRAPWPLWTSAQRRVNAFLLVPGPSVGTAGPAHTLVRSRGDRRARYRDGRHTAASSAGSRSRPTGKHVGTTRPFKYYLRRARGGREGEVGPPCRRMNGARPCGRARGEGAPGGGANARASVGTCRRDGR